MKKSSLYFIYGLLFIIIATTADGLASGVAAVCAILNIILSLVLYYIEDKYN